MTDKNGIFLGVDTSNYTTSLAAVDAHGEVLANIKVPLRGAEGGRGLRQSDAVFEHTRNLPIAMDKLSDIVCVKDALAVGYSSKPRCAEGAYMPCFLSGVAFASALCAGTGAVGYAFAHQDGHIRAAAHSAGFFIAIIISAPNRFNTQLFKSIPQQFPGCLRNQSLTPKRLADPVTQFAFILPVCHIGIALHFQPNTANRHAVF